MDARPEWVPEWIWSGYQSFRVFTLDCLPQNLDGAEHDIHLVESLLQDQGCAAVWRALDKRKGESTRRYRQWCEEHGLSPYFARDEAEVFFDSFTYFASGVPRGAAIPLSERRAIAERIKMHALGLRGELDALNARCNDESYPEALTECVCKLADAISNDCADRNLESDPGLFKERRGDVWSSFLMGVMEGVQSVERTLGALADGADQWAQTKPPIGHPNDPNAARLYFMRKMTNFFRKHYGTPLREAVAVLTRNVYQCEMDVATVAKLAP